MIDGVELIQKTYSKMKAKHAEARAALGRPLTLTEKILATHLEAIADEDGKPLVRITRLEVPKRRVTFGVLAGKLSVPANFDEPLGDDVLAGFEGR